MHRTGLVLFLGMSFILTGCTVRTYRLTRDRVDQDLTAGNRGYLMGQAPAPAEDRKATRTTQMVEVELRPLIKFEKGTKPAATAAMEEPMDEDASLGGIGVAEPEESFQSYTVQKNDTLQKISQKFFGTTRKWNKIYEANKNVLKSPDKIRPGQVIRIPGVSGGQESLKEPAENLK